MARDACVGKVLCWEGEQDDGRGRWGVLDMEGTCGEGAGEYVAGTGHATEGMEQCTDT